MVDYAHLNVGRKFMIIDGEECESRDGKYFSVCRSRDSSPLTHATSGSRRFINETIFPTMSAEISVPIPNP